VLEVEVPKTTKFLYDKVNFENIRSFLEEKDWEAEMCTMNNVEEKWQYFVQMYTCLVEQFVPKRAVKITNSGVGTEKNKEKHRPNVDFHILRTIKRKHRLWQRFIETRDGQKYELFKKQRNKLKGQMRAARRRLFKKISKDAKKIQKNFGLM
jgi:hypothetical protein